MIQLYRKGVWNDERTVNVISTACFLKNNDSKMLTAALKFFLGGVDENEEVEKLQKIENVKFHLKLIENRKQKNKMK